MSGTKLIVARVVSVVAATFISLACGTNYAYSAWAPEFAARLRLSATQSNLIGTMANLGMYASGIPIGLLVDSKGPRPGVLYGAFTLGIGYFLLHRAYESGADSVPLPWLCISAAMTGSGGAAAFAGAIKTAALNWPNHRGTATAFPLAAFGLGAFFFATLSSIAFEDEAGRFLLMLAIGTFALCFVGFFFLRVIPLSPTYFAIPTARDRGRSDSNPLTRTKSGDSKRSIKRIPQELGTQPVLMHEDTTLHEDSSQNPSDHCDAPKVHESDTDETSSLLSKSSSIPGDLPYGQADEVKTNHNSHHSDIRGLAMLPRVEFWQLFLLLGILTGVGLMTINNIGNDARALWNHYDDSASSTFIQKQQSINVSVLSVLSFCGRLLSGVGSDIIVKKLHMSRFWCLVVSSSIFCIAQLCAISIENPHLLVVISSITGLGYGFLYGVFPSLVAETFGVTGLSTNWGFITLCPVIFSNLFNILYGRIFDSHSIILPDGRRRCPDSISCYRAAYLVTLTASLASVFISLWSIRHANAVKAKTSKNERGRDLGREA